MTKILKMEMKGFKSFANRTEVVFGDKFNCVLGPNGSGKSNILDALCFVLGKAGAKGLRVEKSSNLIYNGGKKKKPAKEGEVSIWFDNSKGEFDTFEEKEIKLTRLIKSSGQGVYKINDQKMTRTQIIDLLSIANIDPDGYNIILQGDIVRLIEMSTSDRRKIVEEIAGINIYEDKKNKALRELERVEEKINNAEIILTERETHLKELKKDRNQALKFKRLEDNKKRNRKTLLTKSHKKSTAELEKVEIEIKTNKTKIDDYNKKITDLRKIIEEKNKEIKKLNEELESKGEKTQVEVHKQVESLKVDINVDKQRLNTLNEEINKVKERQKGLQDSSKELQLKIKDIEKTKIELTKRIQLRNNELINIEKRIEEFRKKNNLQEESKFDERVNEIDKSIESISEEMSTLREKQQSLFREKDKIDMQLESIDDKIAKVTQIKEEHKSELEDLKHKKSEFKKLAMDLSKALNQSSEYAVQLQNARNKLLSKREELAKLNARKAALLESVAGNAAVAGVLELGKKDPKIYGTVAELGSASDEFAQALEIAAGNKVKSIVVHDDETAAKCIKFVKDKRLGVISLLPINKLRDVQIDDSLRKIKSPGVVGLAIDLVKYDSKFEKVFKYVFSNTLVVDSIEIARKIGIGKARMVTKTGDITELSGVMQGGYRGNKKTKGVFGQDEVNKEIEHIDKEIADLETVVSSLENKSEDNNELISRLRNLKAELEGEIIKKEKSLHLDSDEVDVDSKAKSELKNKSKDLDKDVDDIASKISKKNQELAKLKIERQGLRDKIMDIRNPAKLAELQSFDEKKSELKEEVMKLEAERKGSDREMEAIIGPENRRILDIIKQHDKEISEFVKEQSDLRTRISKNEKDLKTKEKLQEDFYKKFRKLFDEKSKLAEKVSDSEKKIVSINADIRVAENKNNAFSLDQARIKADLAGLNEELKHYTDVEVFTDKSDEKIKRELNDFEKMAAEIGAVNMRALEIYETVESEYQKLLQKKDTLSKERTEVLVMINQIDSKKKDLFMKTFYSLEEHFKKFFARLLVKGDASLNIENEEDPFAAGVEIKVRLTGKKFLDIRSLSGGEKTMTALAFLFAVQEYEPASFYILDEVDAALDKKNAQKLAELIQSYCERAQYVVISHNDGVIKQADKLYGISMNEHGMSKVTTLKL